MGRREGRRRQLLMTLRKLENTGNWRSKSWIAVSADYAVEEAMDLSYRLRYGDNTTHTHTHTHRYTQVRNRLES